MLKKLIVDVLKQNKGLSECERNVSKLPVATPSERESMDLNVMARPPVRRRTANFLADLSEKTFVSQADEWDQAVMATLSIKKREPFWRFEVDEIADGIPRLKNKTPLVWIDTSYSSSVHGGQGENRARVLPTLGGGGLGGIELSISNEPNFYSRSFLELDAFVSPQLEDFCEIFQTTGFQSVELSYLNFVSTKQYPELSGSRLASMDLSAILATHETLSMPATSFVAPYRHEMNVVLDAVGKISATIDTRIEHVSKTETALILETTVRHAVENASPNEAIDALRTCHDHILEIFKHVFTKNALSVFFNPPMESSPK